MAAGVSSPSTSSQMPYFTAAGAVDVEVDVLVALDALEVEHLHDDAAGGDVVDLADEEDHPVFEQHLLEGHLAVAVVAAGTARARHADGHGDRGALGVGQGR